MDGGSIISNDGASLINNDGGSIISNDGASIIRRDERRRRSRSEITARPLPCARIPQMSRRCRATADLWLCEKAASSI